MDGTADDFRDLGPKKERFYRKSVGSVGLEFNRNKCFLQRVNSHAHVPREESLALDGFDGLATTVCAVFRDDVFLERSGPGGRNPPEILAFCTSSIFFN